MEYLIAASIFLAIILVFVTAQFNSLIKKRNRVKESYQSIDVNLKLRFDLIPNLVNVVNGYSKHEQEIFENLAKSRKVFNNSNSIEEKIKESNNILDNMNRLIATVEAYPELKSSDLYIKLMKSLNEVEEKISAARRFYNSSVNSYNNKREMFPSNIIAKIFGFKKVEFYKIDTNEKENIEIGNVN